MMRCPETGYAASTAYTKYKCRCDSCKQANTERDRRWRAKNPEKAREIRRRKYIVNREKNNTAARRWRLANPEKHREAVQRYRARNPEKVAESCRRWRSTTGGRAQSLWKMAKTRATRQKLAFDLTKDWIQEQVEQGACAVTNLPFSLEANGGRSPWAPSLDRIDPEKGYTKDNVQVVCWLYNNAKHTYSHDDILQLAQALCIPAKN